MYYYYICINIVKICTMKAKRDRFEEVAGRRVQYILTKINQLGNCANRNNYEYTDEDVKKMFGAIKDSLKLTEMRFQDELNKQNKKKFQF